MSQHEQPLINNGLQRAIWITGASSGIGLALSNLYAVEGTTLGLVARRAEALENIAAICRKQGAIVYTYIADVGDTIKMRECADNFLSKVGFVDLVIANAGIRLVEDEDVQDILITERVMITNYFGVVNTFSPFIPLMKKKQYGQLVVISSIGAFRGTPNSGAYSASKAAVDIWTESLRLRLAPYKITVTTLSVGFVETAMTQEISFWMPGILKPNKAAKLIADAISKRKRNLTIPWQSKIIWSILSMLPNTIYDYLILFAKDSNYLVTIRRMLTRKKA